MSALMDEKTREQVEQFFADLVGPVKLVMFTQQFECQMCRETRQIIEEVSGVHAQISYEVLDFVENKDRADALGIEKIPAVAVLGPDDQDYGIRFFGIPSGYEFMSLLESIKLVSTGQTEFDQEMLDYLNSLEDDVHLQVFVTPTCPYCPGAVVLAHHMAFVSDKVKADMVEATEFPELAYKYQVMGVPRTVINETQYIEGAVPAHMVLEKLQAALAG